MSLRSLLPSTLALLGLIVSLGACSARDGATSTGSQSETQAQPVWPVNAQSFVVESSSNGFFLPPPPPGSNCAFGVAKYSLDVATKAFDFSFCKAVDTHTPLALVAGKRVLSPEQLDSLDQVLSKLTGIEHPPCMPDVGVTTLTVTSATGTNAFVDAHTACPGAGQTAVDLGPLLDMLEALSSP